MLFLFQKQFNQCDDAKTKARITITKLTTVLKHFWKSASKCNGLNKRQTVNEKRESESDCVRERERERIEADKQKNRRMGKKNTNLTETSEKKLTVVLMDMRGKAAKLVPLN